MSEGETIPPVVFIDCETDGLGPTRRPWEIAVIYRDPDGWEKTFHWFLPLDDVSAVDGFALRVGRFWDRHPTARVATGNWPGDIDPAQYVTSPNAVARSLFQLTHNAVWVGANPGFDAELVERLLRAHGLQPTWRYHLVDTTVLVLGYLHARAEAGLSERPPVKYRSDDLAKLLGVEPAADEDRHTALGDARWCQRIYDRVTGYTPAAS